MPIDNKKKWNLVPKIGPRRLTAFAAAALGAGIVLTMLGGPATGQFTPLEDVVPTDELEVQTDELIRLSTSMADAVRELRTAEVSVKTLQKLQPSANITGLEMQIAAINLRAAHAKVAVLRAISEKQLAVAQAKLEFLRRITQGVNGAGDDAADIGNPRVAQAAATVEILQMILDIK